MCISYKHFFSRKISNKKNIENHMLKKFIYLMKINKSKASFNANFYFQPNIMQ